MKIVTTIELGRLIRETRKNAKLTQGELAAASHLGERFVRELEQGKPTCQLEKTLKVLKMLGIQLEATPPCKL